MDISRIRFYIVVGCGRGREFHCFGDSHNQGTPIGISQGDRVQVQTGYNEQATQAGHSKYWGQRKRTNLSNRIRGTMRKPASELICKTVGATQAQTDRSSWQSYHQYTSYTVDFARIAWPRGWMNKWALRQQVLLSRGWGVSTWPRAVLDWSFPCSKSHAYTTMDWMRSLIGPEAVQNGTRDWKYQTGTGEICHGRVNRDWTKLQNKWLKEFPLCRWQLRRERGELFGKEWPCVHESAVCVCVCSRAWVRAKEREPAKWRGIRNNYGIEREGEESGSKDRGSMETSSSFKLHRQSLIFSPRGKKLL